MQFKKIYDMRPFKHFICTQLLLQSATGQNYNTHQTNYEINLYNFEVAIMEICVVWYQFIVKRHLGLSEYEFVTFCIYLYARVNRRV